MDYCDPSDLYDHGLPRGGVPNPARPVDSVSSTDDTLTLDVHGFETGQALTFRAEAGGELPSPLVEGTTYYAIAVSESVFQVSATEDGDAIDLADEGEGVLVGTRLPIAACISWGAEIINGMIPAHVIPADGDPIPPILRMTNAELAAGKLLAVTGGASRALTAITDDAQKRLALWAKGIPLRGANTPAPANLAVSATAAPRDSRGWNRYGGL